MAGTDNFDSEEPIASINIVPFVDIILVVLIIFMVTAPLIMKPSIEVNLPEAASGNKTEPSKLGISITKDGTTRLNGQIVSLTDIKTFAKELYLKNPTAQAIISADRELAHGEVIKVIDTIKSTGIKKFGISTSEITQ